ncbi:transient receptor potential cation channel protein painless [Coccinella septempunctata]|uniref:transient receptor potential cation channel protein painless n=1 Tax=Coccinella septempunctata TaxID=41139 RepID=UPI001D05D262|nr:transient receptor potential cation channel protein painless [Coccinella septempunctata]XP_044755453.1 transient receptor potential cation channel protein painless [Coccinella septempunctata]
MDDRKTLSRNNSICPTPEELLLDAVKSNKIQKIKTLVKENERLLSAEYPYPYFGKILYVACSEQGISPETVQLLLQLGAKPFEETEGQGELIHVVSRLCNSQVLKVLIRYLTREEINHTFRGNNALLVLVKEGDYTNRTDFLECARILIKSGVNVNHADLKNLTAVLWAIKKDYRDFIEVLLNNSFDLDIDNYTMNGKSARELIISKYPSELVLPDNFTTISSPKDLLFNYLKSYNEDAFVNYNQGDLSQYKDSDDYTQTLLQLSCQLGLVKATRHLLENKADVRKITDKQPCTPLELAGENGNFKIVELLLEHDKNLRVPSSTLSILLNKMNLSESADNYERCFEELLKNQDETSLNSASDNNFQQTPLHFAVKFAKPKHVLELLRKGSSLANRNEFGIMAIENIEADVLEQHLDDCVDINDIDKNNVYVTLKYRTLLPSPVQQSSGLNYCEEGKPVFSQNLAPETDALLYMCKAPYLKHLLTHPVIDTFLLLKWHKINMIFYTNLVFYALFISSLLTYIFTSYGNFHYIPENEFSLSAIAQVSHFILCLTYVLLVIRELFQILVNPMGYYKDVDNWLEMILIFLVGFIIFVRDPSNDSRKQLSSLAILLSTFELVLMVGQHPRLTTNVVMFKRVSTNFIKFLSWYFLLIAAFAMSFYILFSESVAENAEGETENPLNEENNEEETNFFINPGVALFKTLVMLTGEFDASDMNFHHFPITSKVIFIMFVLMIALILLNLLNGLAVSDTQTIKNDAECVGLMARTEHIHYMESMVLGNIIPSTFLNLLNKIFCCLPFQQNLNITLSQPLSKHISLYPKTEITIPMSNDFEMMKVDKKGSRKESALSVFNSLKLDKKIRRKIRKVMQNQRMVSNEIYVKNKIKQIENEQAAILAILHEINKKLDAESLNYNS